ncbi:MAG: GNAT family N-acetyltransferase [Saccharospirillum sp.]|nr:GNAT family N-acetyltransferase [Saccharospirillum sp.]
MFTKIVNQDIQLALVEPSFARHYYAIVKSERDDLGQWLAWPRHADSEAFFAAFIQKALHDYADGKAMTCAILYRGKVVGNISYNSISHALKKVEIGYWLSQEGRGKGIVTQSVSCLIDYAFDVLGMEKVQISAAVDNQPSRKVCERLGFKLEGIVTRNENLNGRVVDHAIYGLTSLNRLQGQRD